MNPGSQTFLRIKGVFVMLYVLSCLWCSSEIQAAEFEAITVMSYNIHYGQGMDERIDLPRIAKIISDQNPDLVGLQEIGNFSMVPPRNQWNDYLAGSRSLPAVK